MKKIIFALFLLIICMPAFSETTGATVKNPFFGEKQNQIMLNIGQGVNSFGLISMPDYLVPFNMIHFQYSQPTEFFRLPARKSLNAIQTIGYGKKYQYTDYTQTFEWNWTDYTIQIALLSEDVILYNNDKFYCGAGLSVGVQGQENKRPGLSYLADIKYQINLMQNCLCSIFQTVQPIHKIIHIISGDWELLIISNLFIRFLY